MKRIAVAVAALLAGFAGSAGYADVASQPTIEGNYVEVRSCDVFTGPCFANGEVNLTGDEAIMAWDVTRGSWNGVELDGMKVIAAVRANATLGDTTKSPYPAKAVVIVDETATKAQHDALTDLARTMGGKLVDEVVRVETAPIQFAMTNDHENCAAVKAGNLVEISARCLSHEDDVCGNETAFYPPLTDVENARPHFTELDKFAGEGLGVRWSDSGRRSAYLASFSR